MKVTGAQYEKFSPAAFRLPLFVRRAVGLADTDYGVDLMRRAFATNVGPLTENNTAGPGAGSHSAPVRRGDRRLQEPALPPAHKPCRPAHGPESSATRVAATAHRGLAPARAVNSHAPQSCSLR